MSATTEGQVVENGLWSAIGDPTRRRMLDLMLVAEHATATTLSKQLPVTRQAVAKHLLVLDRAGLVRATPAGRETRYRLNDAQFARAVAQLNAVGKTWDARLGRIKRLAESIQHTAQDGSVPSLPAPLLDDRYTLRRATATDVDAIVGLLVEDTRRAAIESTAPESRDAYRDGFLRVDADASQLLLVATGDNGRVVATMQLSFIPGLSRAGSTRLQIEAVRVRSDQRRNGLGGAMIEWAIAEGKRRGAGLVQLTSDRTREDAHRFYDRLGFVASHVGYKLDLD